MIKVLTSNTYLVNIKTRMPFRYGIAELTETPHLFCELNVEVDGALSRGIAADSLVPKWFTKNPGQGYEDEIAAMLQVIGRAMAFVEEAGSAADVFSLWRRTFEMQLQWAAATIHPPLLWNFGVSLVERALIDAYCRAIGMPFQAAVRANLLGLDLAWMHPELEGATPADLLPEYPKSLMDVRHTIGLSDYLMESDIPVQEKLEDGLPQTLMGNIETYGVRFFKIKLSVRREHDLQRLFRIASILEASGADYAFTLDGNEQFNKVEDFRDFWDNCIVAPELQAFLQRLLYVEQPLHRDSALNDDTQAALLAWAERPKLIIDESDAEIHSLRRALECGYAGTSHKNCKGVFKGVANACLLEHRRRLNPGCRMILSGEDLANVGPVALLQDLAVMSTLGLQHVERNGHQYFAGLSMFPDAWQEQLLNSHPDLFLRNERHLTILRIEDGSISLRTVQQAPFGLIPGINLSLAGARDPLHLTDVGSHQTLSKD